MNFTYLPSYICSTSSVLKYKRLVYGKFSLQLNTDIIIGSSYSYSIFYKSPRNDKFNKISYKTINYMFPSQNRPSLMSTVVAGIPDFIAIRQMINLIKDWCFIYRRTILNYRCLGHKENRIFILYFFIIKKELNFSDVFKTTKYFWKPLNCKEPS